MTFEEVKALSNKELRIKAALALGYDRVEDVGGGILIGWLDNGSMAHADIPNYPNDIAAVWELEETPGLDKEKYILILFRMVCHITNHATVRNWALVHALPLDRTCAFVLAMESDTNAE